MKWLTNGDYVIFPPVYLSDEGSYSRTLIDNKKFLLFTSLYGRSFCFNIPISGSYFYIFKGSTKPDHVFVKSDYGQFLILIDSGNVLPLYDFTEIEEGTGTTYLKSTQWTDFKENELKFFFSFTQDNQGYFPGTKNKFFSISILKINEEYDPATSTEDFLDYVIDLDSLPFWEYPLYPSYWNDGNINISLNSSDLGNVVGEHFRVTDSELPTVKFYHGYTVPKTNFFYLVFFNNEEPPIIRDYNMKYFDENYYQFLLIEGSYTWSTDPQKQEDVYNEGDAVDYYPLPNEFLGYVEIEGKEFGIVPYGRRADTQFPDYCFVIGKDYNEHSCHLRPIFDYLFNRMTGEIYHPTGSSNRCIEFFDHLPMSFSDIFWLWRDPETTEEREYLYPKDLFLKELSDPDEFTFLRIYFHATSRFTIGFDSTIKISSKSWDPYERDLNYESNKDKIKNNIPYCYFSDEEPPRIPSISDSDIIGILIALNGYTNMTGCLDFTFNKMFTSNTQGTSPSRYNIFF